jgi:hypothetical protein
MELAPILSLKSHTLIVTNIIRGVLKTTRLIDYFLVAIERNSRLRTTHRSLRPDLGSYPFHLDTAGGEA